MIRDLKPEPAHAPGRHSQMDTSFVPVVGHYLRGGVLARNTFLNFVGQALPLIIGIVTIPYIIRGVGTEGFGILSLAWVLLGNFSIFDLGLGRATTQLVATALGKGDIEQVSGYVWTTVALQGLLGLVGGALLAAITPLLVEHVLNTPFELLSETKITFYLLAASLPPVLLSGSFRGLLEAAQRFDLVNAVKIPSSTAIFLLPLGGVLVALRVSEIVALLAVSRVVTLLAYAGLCVKTFTALRRGIFIRKDAMRRLFSFGGWVTVSNAVSPIFLYLDRFLIGSLLTMTALAYYNAAYEAVTRLWIFPTSLVVTLFPAFSALEGSNDRPRTEILFVRSVKYLLLVMGPVVLGLAFFAAEALALWIGQEFAQQSTITFQLLVLGVFVNSLAHVPFTFLYSVGRPDIPAKFHLLEVPFYVAVGWTLVEKWGIAGAAGAWTLRVSADSLLLFVVWYRSSSIVASRLVENGLIQAIIMLAGLGLGGYLVVYGLSRDGYAVLGFLSLTAGFLYAGWRYALGDAERVWLGNLLGYLAGKQGTI